MFQTVVKDGRLQGYSGFVLKADAFKERLGNMEQPVLLINKFNRLFTGRGVQVPERPGQAGGGIPRRRQHGASGEQMVLHGQRVRAG